jgi:anti-anti-sigma regulatory factor
MITQRRVTIGIGLFLAFGGLVFSITEFFSKGFNLIAVNGLIGAILFCSLVFAYSRGWEFAKNLIAGFVLLSILAPMKEPYLTERFSISLFIPPIVALLVTSPRWMALTALVTQVGMIILAKGQGVFTNPQNVIMYWLVMGGMIMARVMSDGYLANAESQRRTAENALQKLKAQAEDLVIANERMDDQIEQQRRLLDLISVLETPTLTLAEGVLVAPIVGHVDSARAKTLTERLLQQVARQRTRMVVLDIAGVTVLDTRVAQALLQTVQSIRLLGCDVAISGISASVALTLIQLNITLEGVTTVRSPQEALALYMGKQTTSNGNGHHALQI